MRCFIAIDFPEEIKRKIKEIQDKLPEFYGKKTEINNLHLTLKFLGEISDEEVEKTKKKLAEIKFKSFEANIDSTGIFSPKFIKIIWLHITDCDDLQREIENKLKNLFEEEKRFMSHLTIARVKKVKNKEEFLEKIRKLKINPIRFNVNNFKLQKSTLTAEGPKYETIEKYRLL